ncbi:hypothetical protein FJZ17_03845 [Candidatus Pacearchaeota archaeon]|nr:hypothetical protein [Candidatus Pacearchaeota archaeon]
MKEQIKKKNNLNKFSAIKKLLGFIFLCLSLIFIIVSFFHPEDWTNLIKLGMREPASYDMLWNISSLLVVLGIVFLIVGWFLIKNKKDRFFHGTKKDLLKDILIWILFITPAPLILYYVTKFYKNIDLTIFILLLFYGLLFTLGCKKLEDYFSWSYNLYLDQKKDKKFLLKPDESRKNYYKRIGAGLLIISLFFLYKVIFQ